MIVTLNGLPKKLLHDHNSFKEKAKELRVNELKMNLRILILNSSKFKNRGLFNFRFLPLTSKKF